MNTHQNTCGTAISSSSGMYFNAASLDYYTNIFCATKMFIDAFALYMLGL